MRSQTSNETLLQWAGRAFIERFHFPRLLITCARLLARTRNELRRSAVCRAVRKSLDEQRQASSSGHSAVPRIVRAKIDGYRCYVRLCPAFDRHELGYFRRHLIASRMLSDHGLRIPRLLSSHFAFFKHRPCVLIVEQEIAGSDGHDGHRFTAALGADLGRSLAQWHSIDYRPYLMSPRDHHFQEDVYVNSCSESFRHVNRIAEDAFAHWSTMIDQAKDWLEDPAFLGDIVVGHGDFHRRNLVIDDEHVHWIDLEVMKRYPRHVDLVYSVIRLLHYCQPCIEEFERAYFAANPKRANAWRKYRLQCIRFVTVHDACRKFKPPSRPRKGVMDVTESKLQLARAYRMFAIAEAAFQVEERGQSTFEIVRTIQKRRRSIFRERAPQDLQKRMENKRADALQRSAL